MSSTTQAATHAEVVQDIYEAFGRGDVPAILGPLADDVRWDHWPDSFAQRAGVPWLRPRVGHGQVAEFFAVIGTWEISDFQVLDVLASDTQVAVQVVMEARHASGGAFRDEELHVWTFGPDGSITALRHYVDTAKHIAAAAGEDTTTR